MQRKFFLLLVLAVVFPSMAFAGEHHHHEHLGFLSEFINHASHQFEFYISDMVENGFSSPFFLSLLSIAFLYGFAHVLLPGHGKLVMITYFSVTGKKWYHGVLWGAVFALSHVLSAVIIVVFSEFVIKAFTGKEVYEIDFIEKIIFSIIAFIGGVITYKSIRSIVGVYKKNCSCGHCGCSGHSHEGTVLAVLFGAIPCAGAVLVMLFSLSKGVVWYGVLTSLFISFGMFCSISLVAVLSLLAKDKIQKIMKHDKIATLSVFIRLLVGLLVLFVGVYKLFL